MSEEEKLPPQEQNLIESESNIRRLRSQNLDKKHNQPNAFNVVYETNKSNLSPSPDNIQMEFDAQGAQLREGPYRLGKHTAGIIGVGTGIFRVLESHEEVSSDDEDFLKKRELSARRKTFKLLRPPPSSQPDFSRNWVWVFLEKFNSNLSISIY